MKLLAGQLPSQAAGHDAAAMEQDASGAHSHHGAEHGHHGVDHGQDAAGGIEWEDDMVEVNRLTTAANMHWHPGLWMAHCHIAEHMQSGMMFSFNVARRPGAAS